MVNGLREKFNAGFTDAKYRELNEKLSHGLRPIPFRVAETPVFIPDALRDQLIRAGAEIIELIQQEDFKKLTDRSIPEEWKVPNEHGHPHFLTFDFGICENGDGKPHPMLIEMQGFPSLYGFQAYLAANYRSVYDLPQELTPFFHGMTEAGYIALLKEVIIGHHHPDEVVLMDVDAPEQKTAIDFYVTQRLIGIPVVALQDITVENDRLFYQKDGKKVRIKRIYNRLIFDEIAERKDLFESSFDPRISYDVEWVTHPNWFYRISKYTMPFLKSNFVPETRFLSDVLEIPEDLQNYVLKPLFSFAGQGVIIDIHENDIHGISDRENWILQRKVIYAPVVEAPDGGVKAEIRLMYLWPENGEPTLCINLARLSKGKMIGVRYNKDFDWVGGSVGLMSGGQ